MLLFASFVIPLVALGAAVAAASVPILIHLLSRQRVQIVEWAAMRFLVTAQKRRQRRVDRWLLLATRVLLLLLVLAGMAAATPWAESLWQSVQVGANEVATDRPRMHHILVIDSSLSMAAKTDDGTTRFEQAVRKAEQTVTTALPGDGFTLIVCSTTAQMVIPGPTNDPQKVLEELKQLRCTHGTADTTTAMSQIAETLSSSPKSYPRRQVSFFTDMQRSAWASFLPRPDNTIPDVWKTVTARTDFVLIDVGEKDVANLAIVELNTNDPVTLVDSYTNVTVAVQNFSRTDQRQVRLELSLARPVASAAELVYLPIQQQLIEVLPAGQRIAVTFVLEGTARFREPGLHLLQAKLLDRDESLALDDTRTLAIDVRDSLPVLLVNGKSANDVTSRAADYLQEALMPSGRKMLGNPIRPKTISLSEFADPALGDLTNIDCVILADVPTLTPTLMGKLNTHLKRGGGVILGFGPATALAMDNANETLWANGEGLLPGKLVGVGEMKSEGLGFRLFADEYAFRRPPLGAFKEDNVRAGLTTVPFRKYLKLDAPPDGRGVRLLSFVNTDEAKDQAPTTNKFDPALVEWQRGRGRVLVFTSSFNTDWNDWPILPTFLPFIHEMVRHAALSGDRRTLQVGDSIEEFFPVTMVSLNATIRGPDGYTTTVPITATEEAGLARTADVPLIGQYRIVASGAADRFVVVNAPESSGLGRSESDLKRIDNEQLAPIPAVRVVTDPTSPSASGNGTDEPVVFTPKPHGPTVARWLLVVALLLLMLEPVLAWFVGPGRTTSTLATLEAKPRVNFVAVILFTLATLFFSVVIVLALIRGQEWLYGTVDRSLPATAQRALESIANVPPAAPGEATRMRLDSATIFTPNRDYDHRVLIGFAVIALATTAWMYQREARAAGGLRRVIWPLLLRLSAIALMLFWILPQIMLAFEREGRPDVVILLDQSASMATIDQLETPEIRLKADELKRAAGLTELDRLRLAKQLLSRNDGEFLSRLLTEKQVKVHLYTMADQTKLLKEMVEVGDLPEGRASLEAINANGDVSRLGDAVLAVLKTFRGGSLEAIIGFTDGVVTDGEDLAQASRQAARAGVPMFLVGIGEGRDLPDASLSDLRAEEVVLKNDTLFFEVRLSMKGLPTTGTNPTVPVILSERIGDKLIERARELVPLDASGSPVPVKLSTIPTEPGERTYVIEVPKQPGETELGNNRLERVVLVTENKRLKVLYIESYPRYDFRFLKVLLERESDAVRGNKSIELSTYLVEASASYAEQDKSAIRELPTKTELMRYDVVLFGDVDPATIPKFNAFLSDLAEFVKVRGGGLLFLAGTQANPSKLFATPLADVLPIVPTEGPRMDREDENNLTEGWRLKPSAYGRGHPLFRFVADDAENMKIWGNFKPMFWSARNYVAKPAAEVLAVHPDLPAEQGPAGANHPVILQQFYGSGRVIFFAFDESWRWRFRTAEEQYNRFWLQAIRALARERVLRPELKTDKQTAYRKDEPIRLTAQYPDDAPPIEPNTPIKVTLERMGPNRETIPLQLTKVEGTRGTYQTLLTRTPIGDYKFELVSPLPEKTPNKPRAEARVLPPPGERDRITMDRSALSKAAVESRGKFYTLADVDTLIDDLPEFTRVPLNRPVPPVPLWNQFLLFVILTGLLGTEWMLRRRAKLL